MFHETSDILVKRDKCKRTRPGKGFVLFFIKKINDKFSDMMYNIAIIFE